MLNAKLTVVISAGQSRNPDKRSLEQAVGDMAANLNGVHVLKIPHLYDLNPHGESIEALRQLRGDLVVLSWMYDRAAHWVLDRNGIRGQVGQVELKQESDDDEDSKNESDSQEAEERVVDHQPRPQRWIYDLDFRVSQDPSEYLAEIERIASIADINEAGVSTEEVPTDTQSSPLTLEMLQRYDSPENDTFIGSHASELPAEEIAPALFGIAAVVSIDEHPGRRWYPVIDFSRCTNCMECIDFCLFGVYGVDSTDTILVEQADNCRKGCPACSRVCPQNAIIFPQHKTPAIAGAPVDAGGLKIDLSKLFGAPENDEDASAAAARERDEQLILAGRDAVGTSVGIQSRLASQPASSKTDELDGLIDQLDALDL